MTYIKDLYMEDVRDITIDVVSAVCKELQASGIHIDEELFYDSLFNGLEAISNGTYKRQMG